MVGSCSKGIDRLNPRPCFPPKGEEEKKKIDLAYRVNPVKILVTFMGPYKGIME